jgi:hypothetical protein
MVDEGSVHGRQLAVTTFSHEKVDNSPTPNNDHVASFGLGP